MDELEIPIVSLSEELVALAQSFVGTKEEGMNKGHWVEEFQKAVDGKAVGEPWCCAFVQYCVKQVCARHNMVVPLYQTESCMELWNKTDLAFKTQTPTPGCVVIWQHGNGYQGHTGFVTGVNPDGQLLTIEGNTSDGSGINREGDGVYERTRSRFGNEAMHVLGFIRVFT
jgi:hypothetical protein